MATKTIKINLNDHEAMIVALGNVVSNATTISQSMANIAKSLPNTTSEGIAHKYILDKNSFVIYQTRAGEMQTLAEVLHQFAMDTMAKFVNEDRVLATEVANLMLNDPNTSAADKDYIRKHPEEAVTAVEKALNDKGGQS
ncbi:Uncharacterised protein [Streptococcus criceti]|uniref:Uncharacterized protein n=1 Tax=Streptococcus criceti HS-6 TaxID=873449 RepID=G5JNU1_STRCG|nr:hypothetical protein [Streptococcus criceti]EHI73841.1 hypothetical protein STRCR_0254 [Streptococcus criceti HS-6]SUN41750.1 Uncharacterised protein [Streptococcus criceti]